MRKRLCLLLLILLPLVSFAKTTEYHLANGLKLIVREDHRAPVVLSSVWYKVGSSYEHSGITGISHVLEHMMFKGTKKYSAGMIVKMISTRGGQQNAITGEDYTIYYEQLPAKDLALSFELEADRMHNLLLKQTDFIQEMQVVMEERRLRTDDNPQAKTWERFRAAAFVNNPYHHPPIGWMTDLQSMKLHDLKAWYQQWYVPNNAVVIVVGDVEPQQVLALAKKYFESIKPGKVSELKARTEIQNIGEKSITTSLPAKLPWVVMGFNVPVVATAKKPWVPYALEMINGILSAGNSSRLQEEVVRNDLQAVVANSNYTSFSLHNTIFVVSGTPTVKTTPTQLVDALLEQLKRLQTQPVSAKELARVKAQLIAQNVYRKDSLMEQAILMGLPEMVGLPWKLNDEFIQHLEAITSKQIQAVAQRYFVKSNMTVGILQPKKM